MTRLRISPWPPQCAGRVPGDRGGLSRARLGAARHLPGEASPLISATAAPPESPHPITDAGPLRCRDRTARSVFARCPAFNPHRRCPEPRFRPIDL
jgi:hypothetical protein